MPATEQRFNDEDASEPMPDVSPALAGQEEDFWQHACQHEPYYSSAFDFEDYAPAYCVGYVGYAQYGGEYEEAERSLRANWERIKGDSRLSIDDARLAMRAAWDRMAAQRKWRDAKTALVVGLVRHRLRMLSFKLNRAPLR